MKHHQSSKNTEKEEELFTELQKEQDELRTVQETATELDLTLQSGVSFRHVNCDQAYKLQITSPAPPVSTHEPFDLGNARSIKPSEETANYGIFV